MGILLKTVGATVFWLIAVQAATAEAVGRVGFFPGTSFMQISHFSMEGTMTDTSTMPKGYTIPLIDLALETERQVIVDREQGQYLGHPTTVLLEDTKTMICVYPKGHGRGAIVMKRSADAGLTWSERLPTPKSWETSQEVPTIYRVIGPQGTKRLIMFSGLYPIRMAVSEDDGHTWSELESIGDFGGIVAMGDLMRLKNGSYMALFHDDGRFLHEGGQRTDRMVVYKTLSHDGGLTWSAPRQILFLPGAGLCEPGLIRSPDGNQIAMLLRENFRTFNSFVSFSADDGQTWSAPRELPAALTGDRHQLIYVPDGRIFASFRDTTHVSRTKGDWVGWVGTYDDIVLGREGQYRVRLMDNTKGADCSYPALELLPDGTIVATTYGHWTKDEEPYIASVRFTMEELDAKAPPVEQVEVFANGADGVCQYRIPALVVSNEGTLIAACDARVDRPGDLPNNIDIVVKRSADNGRTWGPLQRVAVFSEEEGGGDPCLLVDRVTGTLWLFYDYGVPHPTLPNKRDVMSHVITSTDDGETWSEPRDLTPQFKRDDWYFLAAAPGMGIQLRSGRLIAPVYSARRTEPQHCHALYSDDHGVTWTLGEGVGGPLVEPQIVELDDGRLMMNMRQPRSKKCRAVAFSADAGQTWSRAKDDPGLIEPACQASFIRLTATSNGDDRNRLLFTNPAHSDRRVNMTVRLSYDEGTTWPVSRVIHTGASMYSCMAVLPDAALGLLFEKDNGLTFVRLTLDWLTRGEDRLSVEQ